MKVRAPDQGSKWLLNAGSLLAPLRRKFSGSLTPETKWLHYAGNSQDVSVLVYAHREDTKDHLAYRDWLESVINSNVAYGFSELV